MQGSSEAPRQIVNLEQFTKRPFDDLWLEAITPKFKMVGLLTTI